MHTTNFYNRRIIQYPLVLLISTFALLALRPEVSLYFSSRYLGGAVGDPGLYIWLVESFIANPLRSLQFESLAMYPYPKTVAWSDNFFLPSGLAYALTKIGLSSIEAYNFVVCSALVLNGFVAFLVGRFIKLSIPSSIGTAISVEFSSVLMGNLGHPQLIFFFWLPLIVLPWCLEVPVKRWLFLSGIALSCSFYCSVYYSIFGAVAVFALMPIALFRWRSFQSVANLLKIWGLFACGLLPVAPSVVPYLRVKEAFGARHLFEPSYFAATGASYLAFPSQNYLYARTAAFTHAEALLSPGISPLLICLITAIWLAYKGTGYWCYLLPLSILGVGIGSVTAGSPSNIPEYSVCVFTWLILLSSVFLPWRSSPRIASITYLCLLFFALSFGPGGNPVKHEPAWGLFSALFSFFPGFESIRASGRLGIVASMLSIPMAFYFLQEIVKRFQSLRLLSFGIPLLLTVAVVVENYLIHIPVDEPTARPPIFSALQTIATSNEAAIILPFSTPDVTTKEFSWGDFAARQTRYMNWALASSVKVVNGYSGQRSRIQEDLISGLGDFPSPKSISLLKRICGLRYVVVVASEIKSWNRDAFMDSNNQLPAPLKLISSDEFGNLLLQLPDSMEANLSKDPFFTPLDRPISFEVSTLSPHQPCKGAAERWSKDGDTVKKTKLQDISVSSSSTTLHMEIPQDYPALPGVVSLVGNDCAIEVQCTVR